MNSKFIFLSFVLLAAVCFLSSTIDGAPEACWEICFKNVSMTENERFTDVFKDVLEIIFEIKTIITFNKINKIGFMIDTSVDQMRDPQFNPDILNDPNAQTAYYMYNFGVMLGVFLSFALDNVQFLLQFDQDSAWGCDGYQCTNNCNMSRAFRTLSNYEIGPISHCPDNIEAACSLMNNYMNNYCNRTTSDSNALIIAIVNSDIKSGFTEFPSHDPKCPNFIDSGSLSAEAEGSPCKKFFKYRYVIGVHKFNEKIIKKFVGKEGGYATLPQNRFSYNAVKSLADCITYITRPCCPSGVGSPRIQIAATSCARTRGPLGQIFANYSDHPAFKFCQGNAASGCINPYTLPYLP